MADSFSLHQRSLPDLCKAVSSTSIVDMRLPENQKLRVLVASNGSKDISQALSLVVRLSKNPKIETRAIVDEEVNRLSQETIALVNKSWHSRERNEWRRGVERAQVEYFKQQADELCGWADMLVLAPIDADTFAKMLHGITDCFLLEILRGWDVSKKILLVPGMTTTMWENPMTKKHLSKVRRKWQWVRIMQPILWNYNEKGISKCLVGWDGFNELVDVIKNQAELMTIEHDGDTAGVSSTVRYSLKTNIPLPVEIWALIFEYVGDWEVSRALNVYANIPIPAEWSLKSSQPGDELHIFMRSLEWTILTSPTFKIVDKLKHAPETLKFLSSLCIKLVIKFCLTDLLTYLELNMKEVFWSSFGQKLLPTKASAVYGRLEILEWWSTSPSFLSKDYTTEAIDGASKSGFVRVLDWWLHSKLLLKYSEASLEQASSKGHIHVLEWWKQAGTHQHRQLSDSSSSLSSSEEVRPSLKLLPGKSLLAAAQNNQSKVLRWWDNSGIPITHSESVAKIASQHGHVEVLNTWLELKGEKMAFDCRVLVEPTKNGHLAVLEWWKEFSRNGKGKVQYKTCDIEEALEDSVGSEKSVDGVKRWWARNGLNLGVQVSEWTKVKTL